jgi:hypothetical protein
VSKVEEIEQLIEQLPPENFAELAEWIQQRASATRNHRAFLSSYAPEDEGLYDNALARGSLAGGDALHRW